MRKFILTAAAATAAIMMAGEASATVTINILQNGTGVTATGSGTLNVTGMAQSAAPSFATPYIEADRAALFTGAALASQLTVYTGFTSVPASFGWGTSQSAPLMMSGSFFGITNSVAGSGTPALALLNGFVSGGSILFSDQWIGQSFASLGLMTGSYTYKLPSDNVVINIGPVSAAVPEPATWAMTILGLGLVGTALRRRRAAVPAAVAA